MDYRVDWIGKEIVGYWKSPYGKAWDEFWEYRCQPNIDIFSRRDIDDTVVLLLKYLKSFGMYRGKNGLHRFDVDSFKNIYRELIEPLKSASAYQFLSIKEEDIPDYEKEIVKIYLILNKYDIKGDVIITKILMATTGETLAFDSHCERCLKTEFGISSYSPYIAYRIYQCQDIYRQNQEQIERIKEQYRKTRCGNPQIIPKARLLDMAMWSRDKK
jgi:hypothetical protein